MYIKAFVEPKLAMVNQMALGLQLFGVLEAIQQHPKLMRPLFVCSAADLTADTFLDMLDVVYSPRQLEKEKEMQTFKCFCDYIQALQYEGNKF